MLDTSNHIPTMDTDMKCCKRCHFGWYQPLVPKRGMERKPSPPNQKKRASKPRFSQQPWNCLVHTLPAQNKNPVLPPSPEPPGNPKPPPAALQRPCASPSSPGSSTSSPPPPPPPSASAPPSASPATQTAGPIDPKTRL